jgi:hypothetical protein
MLMAIDEDDLDQDEDLCLYQGKPFSGTTQHFHSNGQLKREFILVDCFDHGLYKE